MSARKGALSIQQFIRSMRSLFGGNENTIRSRIAIPDFRKAAEQEGGRKRLRRVLYSELFLDFEVVIYPSGCTPENNGYVSVLFGLILNERLGMDNIIADEFEFTCIVSVVDNAGAERFTQSFVKVLEKDEETRFGFEQFVKCRTLLNNFDEFISNDKLTISCYCIRKEKRSVMPIMQITNFPDHVSESCPSSIKCHGLEIEECCKGLFSDSEGKFFKLLFRGPLFEFLKKESNFFQRIEEVQMRERGDNFMKIPLKEILAFMWMQTAVFSHGTFKLYGASGSSQGKVYLLYEIAYRYEINCILEACSDYLKKTLTAENVVKVLFIADLHNNRDLKAAAIDFIKSTWPEVKDTKDWYALERSSLINEFSFVNFDIFS